MSRSVPSDPRPLASVIDFRAELLRRRTVRGLPQIPEPNVLDSMLDTLTGQLAEANRLIEAQRNRIALLECLSLTDELTGLLNRRGFLDQFRRELATCRRGVHHGGVLVLIDLDRFKAINDTYGHPIGDAYLRQIGRALTHSVRDHDVVGRLGGDEFGILLINVEGTAGMARAADLGEQLNRGTAEIDGVTLPFRLSLGSVPFGPMDEVDTALATADQRLYRAKRERTRLVSPLRRGVRQWRG